MTCSYLIRQLKTSLPMPSRHSVITLLAIAILALLPLPGQEGLSYWEEKAALYEAGDNPDSLAFYYRKIAEYHHKQDSLASWAYAWWDWQAAVFDNSPLALSLLDSAVQQAWRAPQNAREAEALLWVQVNRGYHLFQLGKVLAAVKAYESALQWLRQYPMPEFDALEYLYLPLGAHYTRLGDNEKARALYEQAIRQHPHGPQDGALAGLYNNLGLTFWNAGQYQEAIAVYHQGLQCTGLPPLKQALLNLSLGQSLLDAGRHADAAPHIASALATLRSIHKEQPNDGEISDYLSGACAAQAIGLAYVGRTAEAAAQFRKALALVRSVRRTDQHRDVAKLQLELGRLYLYSEEATKALQAFHQALCSLVPGLPDADLNALPSTEQLYEENTLLEALECKADALWMQYRQEKEDDLLLHAMECHRLAGAVETRLRRLLQYESSKINLLSQSRRRASKAIAVARALYQATGKETYLYEAWAEAEQVKAVILLEAAQHNRFRLAAQTDAPLMAADRRLRQQIAYFERQLLLEPASPLRGEWMIQLDELKGQLANTEQQLQAQYPAWAALRAQAEGLTAQSIRNAGKSMPDHALIEYFVGDSGIDIFVLGPGGQVVWKTITGADTLSAQVQQFLALLQSRTGLQSPGPYRELAYALYAALVQPALSALRQPPARLLLVPDAWLVYLPFEALYCEPAPEAVWERAPFMLRQHGIQYAFSLAVWQSQRDLPSRAAGNILQFAPRFASGQRQLTPLIQSAEEAPVTKTCRSKLYLDEKASWDALSSAASGYRVLHLSTHAGVDTAGSVPRVELYDRAAYLPDVYALSLQADLVVLSACQTALGQFRQGEGVMSLSRAFTYAGAKGLVAGLWRINEGATYHILGAMYHGLQNGASKPEALRQAKISYLDDAAIPSYEKSPYYWAGLVYTGDEAAVVWSSCSLGRWGYAALAALCLGTLLFLRAIWKLYARKNQPG